MLFLLLFLCYFVLFLPIQIWALTARSRRSIASPVHSGLPTATNQSQRSPYRFNARWKNTVDFIASAQSSAPAARSCKPLREDTAARWGR